MDCYRTQAFFDSIKNECQRHSRKVVIIPEIFRLVGIFGLNSVRAIWRTSHLFEDRISGVCTCDFVRKI